MASSLDKCVVDDNILLPYHGQVGDEGGAHPAYIVLYVVILCYCCAGVSIPSNIFTGAIEKIISKKKLAFDSHSGRYRTVKIWNDTMVYLFVVSSSNLPVILLNIYALIFKDGMYSGDLGPATVVGSSSFHILIVVAICVVSIPEGEVRIIKDVAVVSVFVGFALLGPVWLVVILTLSTPDVVDIWEAVALVAFFPLLALVAFLADKGYLGGGPSDALKRQVMASEMTKDELAELVVQIKAEYGEVDDDAMKLLIEQKTGQRGDRARYRALATRQFIGAGRHHAEASSSPTPPSPREKERQLNDSTGGVTSACIQFASPKYGVLENGRQVKVELVRTGDESSHVKVQYKTEDGAAHAGEKYVAIEGVVDFAPGAKSQFVTIALLDDSACEPGADFFVRLDGAECEDGSATIGPLRRTTVTILKDDDAGFLGFSSEFVEIERGLEDTVVQVRVVRKRGAAGRVSCKYMTEDDSAFAFSDYEGVEGEVVMEAGQTTFEIPITVKACGRCEGTECFRVLLQDPTGGACFDPDTDGGEKSCICTISLKVDMAAKGLIDVLSKNLAVNWDVVRIGSANWKDQFICALYVNGSPEGQMEASLTAWVSHVLFVPWKLFFALIPPTDYADGFACLIPCLALMAVIIVLIADSAANLGCSLGVPDALTAITVVTVGTSMPDVFASWLAAKCEPYADGVLIEILGSISANMFMGLGVSWSVGAIYWRAKGPTEEWREQYPSHAASSDGYFVVRKGGLLFSVVVIFAWAAVCILVLFLRRRLLGGELGGPRCWKVGTALFLCALWVMYLVLFCVYTWM